MSHLLSDHILSELLAILISTIQVIMRTSRDRSHRDISLFVMLTVVGRLLLVVDCQFVTEEDEDLKTLCSSSGQDCRLISRCPAVLKLVFKVGGQSQQPTMILCLSIILSILWRNLKYILNREGLKLHTARSVLFSWWSVMLKWNTCYKCVVDINIKQCVTDTMHFTWSRWCFQLTDWLNDWDCL